MKTTTTKASKKEPKDWEILQNQFEVIECLKKANDEMKKAFEIEMNCKNQVYYFILSRGYFDEYKDYTKDNPVKE